MTVAFFPPTKNCVFAATAGRPASVTGSIIIRFMVLPIRLRLRFKLKVTLRDCRVTKIGA